MTASEEYDEEDSLEEEDEIAVLIKATTSSGTLLKSVLGIGQWLGWERLNR